MIRFFFLGLLFGCHLAMAGTWSFPNTLDPREVQRIYGPAAKVLAAHLGKTQLTFDEYAPSSLNDMRRAAQAGVIVVPSVLVSRLLEQGFTPVAYQANQTAVVLALDTDALDRGCVRLARLPRGTTLGMLENRLMAEAGLAAWCRLEVPTAFQALQKVIKNQLDAAVMTRPALSRLAAQMGRPLTVRSELSLPGFAFMTLSRTRDWSAAFEAAETVGITGQHAAPIRAWQPEVEARYLGLVWD